MKRTGRKQKFCRIVHCVKFVETFVLAFCTVKVGQGFLHLTMCTKMQVDNPVIF